LTGIWDNISKGEAKKKKSKTCVFHSVATFLFHSLATTFVSLHFSKYPSIVKTSQTRSKKNVPKHSPGHAERFEIGFFFWMLIQLRALRLFLF